MAPIAYGISAPPGSRGVCSIRNTLGSSARTAIRASGGLPSEGYPNFPLIAPSEIWRMAGHAAPGAPDAGTTPTVAAGSERAGDDVGVVGAAVQARTIVTTKTATRRGIRRVCANTRTVCHHGACAPRQLPCFGFASTRAVILPGRSLVLDQLRERARIVGVPHRVHDLAGRGKARPRTGKQCVVALGDPAHAIAHRATARAPALRRPGRHPPQIHGPG